MSVDAVDEPPDYTALVGAIRRWMESPIHRARVEARGTEHAEDAWSTSPGARYGRRTDHTTSVDYPASVVITRRARVALPPGGTGAVVEGLLYLKRHLLDAGEAEYVYAALQAQGLLREDSETTFYDPDGEELEDEGFGPNIRWSWHVQADDFTFDAQTRIVTWTTTVRPSPRCISPWA